MKTAIKRGNFRKLTRRDRLYTRIIYLILYEFVSANHEASSRYEIKDKIITLEPFKSHLIEKRLKTYDRSCERE